MTNLNGDRVIEILSTKLAESIAREAMQQTYAEQLEKQIALLQEQVREYNELVPSTFAGSTLG